MGENAVYDKRLLDCRLYIVHFIRRLGKVLYLFFTKRRAMSDGIIQNANAVSLTSFIEMLDKVFLGIKKIHARNIDGLQDVRSLLSEASKALLVLRGRRQNRFQVNAQEVRFRKASQLFVQAEAKSMGGRTTRSRKIRSRSSTFKKERD